MSINFNTANGAANWLHNEKAETYGKISRNYRIEFPAHRGYEYEEREERSNKPKTVVHGSHWNRLSGFPQGVKCAAYSVMARIIGVVEPLFKGLANMFGSPFFNKCSFKTGIKQLAMDFPLNILKFVFVMPCEVIADLVVSPFAVMLDKDYARARAGFENEMIEKGPSQFYGGQEWDDFEAPLAREGSHQQRFDNELFDEESSSSSD